MHLVIGMGIVVLVACLATWVNDNVPVGEYIEEDPLDPHIR